MVSWRLGVGQWEGGISKGQEKTCGVMDIFLKSKRTTILILVMFS